MSTRGERPVSCSKCGYAFRNSSALVKHRQVHTGERAFSCPSVGRPSPAPPICGGTSEFMIDWWSSNSSVLLRHQQVHTGEEAFQCPKCRKGFTRASHLLPHRRVHTGQRPYSCPECGRGFTQASNLLMHWQIHTGERPFSCPECRKGFTRSPTCGGTSEFMYHCNGIEGVRAECQYQLDINPVPATTGFESCCGIWWK
ncbi:zinc finger protein 572-like [Chiloscyllium plagiosum]|uniref:zinc finger protein 572-like n=1 Tax=Chiloscyllium plagiosum TaxID=36176 RepID=UPI001CB7F71E|nr:zinc finger protein 572-like [Chiloscyllium plagiosum]